MSQGRKSISNKYLGAYYLSEISRGRVVGHVKICHSPPCLQKYTQLTVGGSGFLKSLDSIHSTLVARTIPAGEGRKGWDWVRFQEIALMEDSPNFQTPVNSIPMNFFCPEEITIGECS